MYCPPAYLTDSQSSKQRYRLFDKVDTRFLCSPQFMSGTKSLQAGLDRQGYALDNGAYLDYLKDKPFDSKKYLQFVKKYIHKADWIVLPDVVCNKDMTIQKSRQYIDVIKDYKASVKMLFVWQDGMTETDLRPFTSKGVGVFVGGSTKAKMDNLQWIAKHCKDNSVWCHVGRINTLNRLEQIYVSGANSFDGSGIVRFLPTLELLSARIDNERRQLSLFEKNQMTKTFINEWIQT